MGLRMNRFCHRGMPGDPRRYASVHMRFHYSRLASPAEFEKLHGYGLHQWRSPYAAFQHDKSLFREMAAKFGHVPPPWDSVISSLLNDPTPVSAKLTSDFVQIPEQCLPTTIPNSQNTPCVLIGSSASSIPGLWDEVSISEICFEAARLGEQIIKAWHAGTGDLKTVPSTFYASVQQQWQAYRGFSSRQFAHMHGLDEGPKDITNVHEALVGPDEMQEDMANEETPEDLDDGSVVVRETMQRRAQLRREAHIRLGQVAKKAKPIIPAADAKQRSDKGKSATSRKRSSDGFQLAFTNSFVCHEKLREGTRLKNFMPMGREPETQPFAS